MKRRIKFAAAWPLIVRAQAAFGQSSAHRRAREHGRECWNTSRLSRRGWRNWAGPSAATCGSNTAGVQAILIAFADTLRSWSRSRRMSSWLVAARSWARFSRQARQRPLDPVGKKLEALIERRRMPR